MGRERVLANGSGGPGPPRSTSQMLQIAGMLVPAAGALPSKRLYNSAEFKFLCLLINAIRINPSRDPRHPSSSVEISTRLPANVIIVYRL